MFSIQMYAYMGLLISSRLSAMQVRKEILFWFDDGQ